ncbi:MAG: hypothetical protein WC130_03805 [Kiritimatiellia bacterium]
MSKRAIKRLKPAPGADMADYYYHPRKGYRKKWWGERRRNAAVDSLLTKVFKMGRKSV